MGIFLESIAKVGGRRKLQHVGTKDITSAEFQIRGILCIGLGIYEHVIKKVDQVVGFVDLTETMFIMTQKALQEP